MINKKEFVIIKMRKFQILFQKGLSILFISWLMMFPILFANKVYYVINKENEYANNYIDKLLTTNFIKKYVCQRCGDYVYKSICAFLISFCWGFSNNIKLGII